MKRIFISISILLVLNTLIFAEGKKVTLRQNNYYLDSKVVFYEYKKYGELNKEIQKNIVEPFNLFVTEKKQEWDEYDKIRQETQAEGVTDSSVSTYASLKSPKFEYKTFCDKKIEGKKYISLLYKNYTFLGGAHGDSTLYTVLFNKEENKIINIEEISNLSLQEISKLCFDELIAKIKDTEKYTPERIEWIKEGTLPVEDNFMKFTFNEKNKTLTVYFEQYTVAPYSDGIQLVEIKLN
ncbi:MAG: DUF3298 domain-containing protein [Treponema sp.]|nr:DUF3298 domain-containing protein [Treponema sp.]